MESIFIYSIMLFYFFLLSYHTIIPITIIIIGRPKITKRIDLSCASVTVYVTLPVSFLIVFLLNMK